MEKCIFDSKKACNDCKECDICDLNNKKICDNCGKCLEMEGVDIKAVKIEELAKDVEENKIVEEDLENEVSNDESFEKISLELDDDAKKFLEDNPDLNEEEYDDAFNHIEYIEELDVLNDDLKVEEMTEEVFPGVRRLKKNSI